MRRFYVLPLKGDSNTKKCYIPIRQGNLKKRIGCKVSAGKDTIGRYTEDNVPLAKLITEGPPNYTIDR